MKIGKREKKVIILGGVAALLIFSYLSYDWFIGYKDNIETKKNTRRNQLGYMIRKAAEKDETEKRLVEVKNELAEAEKKLVPGDKPAVGAAELQRILKDMASLNGIDITSEKILNPLEVNPYTAISIEVTFVSTAAKFRNLLYGIENSPFLLTIPDMKIRVTNVKNPTDVQVTLAVRGLMRKHEEGEKKEGGV